MEYFYVALVYLLSSLVMGLTGFGSALIAMPLLALFLDMTVAVPVSVLLALTQNIQLGVRYRSHVRKERILPLLIGSVPGMILGVTMLHAIPEVALVLMLSGFIAVYAVYGLVFEQRRGVTEPVSLQWGYAAGVGSGALGAALAVGGPPVIIFSTMRVWPKDVVKATLSVYFLLMGGAVAVAHAVSGLVTPYVLLLCLAAIPAVWIGVQSGMRLSGYIGEGAYRQAVFVLLLAMAAVLFVPNV